MEIRKMRKISLFAAALLAASVGPTLAQDYTKDKSPVNATIAGAAPQGIFATAGEAVNEMVRREYPNSAVTYEPGSTAGSLARMMSGQVPLATAHSPIDVAAALNGTEPFKQKMPAENLRVIARVTEGMHPYVFARPDFAGKHQIKTMGDLFKKPLPMRINLNQKGTLPVYHQALALLEYYKTSEDQIKKNGGDPTYLPTTAALDALKDGKIDVIIWVGFTPDRNARQLIDQDGMIMLPIEEAAIDHVAKKFNLEKEWIKAGTYKGQDKDLPATSLPIFMSAGPSADDRTVYAVTNSIIKHFEYFRSVHPLFKTYQPAMLVNVGSLKMHPAAEKAYREAGLLK